MNKRKWIVSDIWASKAKLWQLFRLFFARNFIYYPRAIFVTMEIALTLLNSWLFTWYISTTSIKIETSREQKNFFFWLEYCLLPAHAYFPEDSMSVMDVDTLLVICVVYMQSGFITKSDDVFHKPHRINIELWPSQGSDNFTQPSVMIMNAMTFDSGVL